jgi:hypothetical protein
MLDVGGRGRVGSSAGAAARGFSGAMREFFTGEAHRASLGEDVLIGVLPDITRGGGVSFIAGGTATSLGKAERAGTVDLAPTLRRIAAGETGAVFMYLADLLPTQPAGYYRRFVIPTPGVKGAGPQRLITGQGGELFYSPLSDIREDLPVIDMGWARFSTDPAMVEIEQGTAKTMLSMR